MRLAPFLLSLALLPAGLTATAAGAPTVPDAGARQEQASVSLSASAAWVRKGGIVLLRGKVRGARGRTTVTIYQKKLRRGSSWNVEARKRTSRRGAFRHSENILTGHRKYKACAKGRCSQEVTVRMGTPPPPASVPTALTLTSMSTSSVDAGAPFTVQGTATNLDGQTVQVQAYDAGSSTWTSLVTAIVTGGQWTATTSVTATGRSVPIRAFFSGVPGLASSASNESSLTVFGWFYLTDLGFELDDDVDTGPGSLAGTTFTHSLWATGCNLCDSQEDGWRVVTSAKCSHFRTTVGMLDAAEVSEKPSATIYRDGQPAWSQQLSYGRTTAVALSVEGTLQFEVRLVDEGYPALGDPMLRCAF